MPDYNDLTHDQKISKMWERYAKEYLDFIVKKHEMVFKNILEAIEDVRFKVQHNMESLKENKGDWSFNVYELLGSAEVLKDVIKESSKKYFEDEEIRRLCSEGEENKKDY